MQIKYSVIKLSDISSARIPEIKIDHNTVFILQCMCLDQTISGFRPYAIYLLVIKTWQSLINKLKLMKANKAKFLL